MAEETKSGAEKALEDFSEMAGSEVGKADEEAVARVEKQGEDVEEEVVEDREEEVAQGAIEERGGEVAEEGALEEAPVVVEGGTRGVME